MFDQTPISDARVGRHEAELVVSWTSSAPAGTVYQVYLDRGLAWHGTATRVNLPWPTGLVQVDIGAVGPSEGGRDFSGSLVPGHAQRATLAWQGGSYLGPSLDHFAVFGSAAVGGAVSYAKPLGTVPAYTAGVITDGYGFGGYGEGGYGQAPATYTWTSQVLAPGVWHFAVVPVDEAGNQAATPTLTAVTIMGPPRAPAPYPDGTRLRHSFNPATRVPTLLWNPSPA